MVEPRRDPLGPDDAHEFEERVVEVNRVAKVVKGGRRFSFTALVVVGDRAGRVGVGYGKAREVPMAIQKGVEEAKKNFMRVPMAGSTITHAVTGEWGGAKVLLRPAAPGTGVIAGGGVRAILECAGVRDVLGKSLGSNNAINVVRATIDALANLRNPEEVSILRGLPAERIMPRPLVEAYKQTNSMLGPGSLDSETSSPPVSESAGATPRTTESRVDGDQ